MDSVQAIRSTQGPLDTYVQALGEAKAFHIPASRTSSPTSNPSGSDPSAGSSGPRAARQAMLHFISHVDAECFISLLKILDPPPDDERKRAEYRRYYRQLQDALTIPPSPPDPQPIERPLDPLW